MQTNLEGQKADQRLPEVGEGIREMGENITMGHKVSSEGDGYDHYLNCDDGLMGIYMTKLIKLHGLNMCSLVDVNHTSIKW